MISQTDNNMQVKVVSPPPPPLPLVNTATHINFDAFIGRNPHYTTTALAIWTKCKELGIVANVRQLDLYDALDAKYGKRIICNRVQSYAGIYIYNKTN